jgi:hypothetical protein
MPNSGNKQTFAAARELLKQRIDFEDFLSKLSPKDRTNAERRVTALEAEPEPNRARLWKQLVCTMITFAPAAKFVGSQTVQFYVPDGKHRMQVFALEDLQDGNMTVYCPNVLDEAIKGGLLSAAPGQEEPNMYSIASSKDLLRVEPLDKNSTNAAAHFKDLLGWNRKALRVTLLPAPSASQLEATELLCAIAAQHFVANTLPSVAVAKKS